MRALNCISIFTLSIVFGATMKGQCSPVINDQNVSGSIVQFTVQPVTTGSVINHVWFFGDGDYTTTVNSPTVSHNYPHNGVFVVTFHYIDSVSSTPCWASLQKTVVVSNGTCSDSISFKSRIKAGGEVEFQPSVVSSNYTYSWDFGDGTQSSVLWPTHTYTASGMYTPTLVVAYTPTAVCSYSIAKTMSVPVLPCPVSANFTYVIAGNTATLTNTSSGVSTSSSICYWYMEGNQIKTGPQVVHTFSNNGVYDVFLWAHDSSVVICSDTIRKQLSITSGSCLLNASFVSAKDSSQPLTWYIYPYVSGNLSAVEWSWGDGSTSNVLYTSHTYSTAGTYSICLSATASCGSSTTVCNNTSIYRTTGGSAISVTVLAPVTSLADQMVKKQKLHIMPNPSTGQVTIRTPDKTGGPIVIRVFDMLGREMVCRTVNESTDGVISLDLETMNAGTYFIVLSCETGIYNGKLILQD